MAESRVAVFGGTFNPVHNGHIAIAESALVEFGFGKIVFLPNGNPPHKNNLSVADASARYDMVSIVAGLNERFDVSDYEIRRDKPSYTIDTLPHLKSAYGNDITYIIGADSLYTLHKWKEYRRLIRECKFIVADRNSNYGTDLIKACECLNSEGANIKCMKMPKIDITSTHIRNLASQGLDFSQYVPEKIYRYIINNNLYQPCMEGENDY